MNLLRFVGFDWCVDCSRQDQGTGRVPVTRVCCDKSYSGLGLPGDHVAPLCAEHCRCRCSDCQEVKP